MKRRSEEARASAALATGVIVWGGLAGALVVAAIGWFITRSLSGQIGAAVGHVQSSSAELQAAANQQATGAKEQATAMTEITTTISELLATSRQIAESAQRVARNAEQTASAARLGHGTVDLTHESISGIRRQVDQIVAHMLELGKKSQEIGAVLDIVVGTRRADQHPGDQRDHRGGRRGRERQAFAVVADEIRKLADRVGGSTKEIRTLIDDVRSAVNTTVMATETGFKGGRCRIAAVRRGGVRRSRRFPAWSRRRPRRRARSNCRPSSRATAVEQVNIAIANVAQASRETETSAGQTLADGVATRRRCRETCCASFDRTWPA